MMVLGKEAFTTEKECLLTMYHRAVEETSANYVIEKFPQHDSPIRIIFATVAFGLGVDIPDVRYVVHWGMSRSMETYLQESGRAGRDGELAYSIVYVKPSDYVHINKAVATYCKSFVQCRRKQIADYFCLSGQKFCCKVHANQRVDIRTKGTCKCCDFCYENCRCENCFVLEWTNEATEFQKTFTMGTLDKERCITDGQLEQLRLNLLQYRDLVSEEGTSPLLYNSYLMTGLFDYVIDSIVSIASSVFSVEDIVTNVPILTTGHAEDIIKLIDECLPPENIN